MTKLALKALYSEWGEVFPENTITVFHDGDKTFAYGMVIKFFNEPRVLDIAENTIEDTLTEYLKEDDITSEEHLKNDCFPLSLLNKENTTLLYRISTHDLKEKFKMQKLLDLPLVDIMEPL
jgi:hypothetical protein